MTWSRSFEEVVQHASAGPDKTAEVRVNPAHLRETIDRGGVTSEGRKFIDENGGGPGVRLRKRHQKKS